MLASNMLMPTCYLQQKPSSKKFVRFAKLISTVQFLSVTDAASQRLRQLTLSLQFLCTSTCTVKKHKEKAFTFHHFTILGSLCCNEGPHDLNCSWLLCFVFVFVYDFETKILWVTPTLKDNDKPSGIVHVAARMD